MIFCQGILWQCGAKEAVTEVKMAGMTIVSNLKNFKNLIPETIAPPATSNLNSNNDNLLDVITEYKVTFKKIRIGNAEADAQVLWENSAGEEKDITSQVSFNNVQSISEGTYHYHYVELTIGKELKVKGSLKMSNQTHTGQGTATIANEKHLFSTQDNTLATALTVKDGSTLTITFDVQDTVTYTSGSADAAILEVTKPQIAVSLQ